MDQVWVSCPFCAKLVTAVREQLTKGHQFTCTKCGKCWSEPTHTINLNKHGENGYIKPRRK